MGDLYYHCRRCASCCRWPGYVALTQADIQRIAAFLGLSEYDFIEQYTRLEPGRRGLALTDHAGGACIFLDGCDCTVHPVKPEQCRGFPQEWSFPGFERSCMAARESRGA